MSRIAASIGLDVRLQARSRLYVIGVVVAVFMGVMVRFLVPIEHVGRGLTAFYILGLGSTTFMFGAAMLLLEKSEHTLQALRTSPLSPAEYVTSKALTLTAFSLVESAIIFAIAARGVPVNPALLVLGIGVLGVMSTLVGLGLAAAHDAVTSFLLPSGALVGMVAQLPFLTLIGFDTIVLWYLIPTQAPLLLIQAAFEPLAPWQWAYAAGMSAVGIGVAWWFCARRFRVHLGFGR